MGRYYNRLKKACVYYVSCQRDDGGWGARPRQLSSIVNTTEVLFVLHAGGVRFEERPVQRALKFLAEAVVDHPISREGQTRYSTYGLLGLLTYPEARHVADLAAGVGHCREWLASHIVESSVTSKGPASAFPEHVDVSLGSLFQTSVGLIGLRMMDPFDPLIEPLANFLLEATTRGGAWPVNPDSSLPSPTQTARCCLALHGLGGKYDTAARRGVAWLLDNSESWWNLVEQDDAVEGTTWFNFAYAWGVAGCCGTGVDPRDKRLWHSLKLLERLWDEDRAQWREGTRQAVSSVRATYAAVFAIESLREGFFSQDPLDLLETFTPPDAGRSILELATLRIKGCPSVSVDVVDNVKVIDLGVSDWHFLHTIAERVSSTPPFQFHVREMLKPAGVTSESSLRKKISRLNMRFTSRLGRNVLLLKRLPNEKGIYFINASHLIDESESG